MHRARRLRSFAFAFNSQGSVSHLGNLRAFTTIQPDFHKLLQIDLNSPPHIVKETYKRAALESLLVLSSHVTQQRFHRINAAFHRMDAVQKDAILRCVTEGEPDGLLAWILSQPPSSPTEAVAMPLETTGEQVVPSANTTPTVLPPPPPPRDYSTITTAAQTIGQARMEGEAVLAGVAVLPSGQWVVVDVLNHHLQVLDATDGREIRTIGKEGTGPGCFRYPFGLAVLPNSQGFVVSEYLNHRLQVVDNSGNFLAFLGDAEGQLSFPMGIAVDHEGNVVVADSQHHCVQVFSVQGGPPLRTIPNLHHPMGVAVDSEGHTWVAEWDTGFLARLDGRTGEVLRRVEVRGFGPLLGCRPSAVALDSAGRLVVLDKQGGGVHFLTSEGKPLHRLVLDTEPKGVALDREGRVLVTCADGTIRVL
eukprot:GGOE01003054.1.p1 GENE.GGOE01003054.1~~GGOE01003054.1.p1  ORF type:complete len:419 (+),score=76.84 GGOE01003054.1:38-1294(+)